MSWLGVKVASRAPENLRERWRKGRFPHALFFVGPAGVGKRTFARVLAQAILCEARAEHELKACGLCTSCKLVAADAHPDLLETRRPEDKQDVSVELVRQLCDWFALKPMRGARKVAILDDADDLTTEASNAFLKTLEEPPPGAILILIGTAPELQLETVVSRCQVERFAPLPAEELADLLLEKEVVSDRAAALELASMGEGSIARAMALADPETARFRRVLFEELAGPAATAPDLASRMLAFARTGARESAEQRRRAELMVGEIARLLQAALKARVGLALEGPAPEIAQASAQLAQHLSPEQLVSILDRCLEAEYHIGRRLYLPLVLESFIHDLGVILDQGRMIATPGAAAT